MSEEEKMYMYDGDESIKKNVQTVFKKFYSGLMEEYDYYSFNDMNKKKISIY